MSLRLALMIVYFLVMNSKRCINSGNLIPLPFKRGFVCTFT